MKVSRRSFLVGSSLAALATPRLLSARSLLADPTLDDVVKRALGAATKAGELRRCSFLIENGAIAAPVNNFRCNESPIQMLAKCDALGTPWLADGLRVPALRTHEFDLASVSEAV